MNVIIRPATSVDLPFLKVLGAELQENERRLYPDRAKASDIIEKYSEIFKREFELGQYQVFVAEIGGELVGYTAGCSNDPEDDLADFAQGHGYHVDDLIVAGRYRGQGIGAQLLKEITDYARKQGFISIELNVLAANTEAQAFYRSQGFEDYELVLRKKL